MLKHSPTFIVDVHTPDPFVAAWSTVQADAVAIAKSKGWYDDPWIIDRGICLIHAEVSEISEAMRDANPEDKICPGYSSDEVEAADVVIRIMDMANRMGWNLPEAILAKMNYNRTRPYKHGRQF